MTTTLNATTSNGLVITPDNSGNIQLQYNGVAAPAFAANCSGAPTSLIGSSYTKMIYSTEIFDTNNCYNNTGSTATLNGISVPSYSFAPNVAGYYLVSANHSANLYLTNTFINIYKNGVQYAIGSGTSTASTGINPYFQVSQLVSLNGTSDYVNIYVYNSGSTANSDSSAGFIFSACLLRSA